MPARTLRETVGEQPGRWDYPHGYALCRHLAPLVKAAKEFFAVANAFTLDVDCTRCGTGLSIGDRGLVIVADQNGETSRGKTGRWGRRFA